MAKKEKKTWSLRAKILAVGLGALLFSTIILGLYALNRGEAAILQSAEAKLGQTSAQAAKRLGEVLTDAESDVAIWSKLDAAPQSLDTKAPKFFAELAKQVVQNKPVYAYQVLTRADGALFAMNEVDSKNNPLASHPLRPASFKSDAWFAGALKPEGSVLAGPLTPTAIGDAGGKAQPVKVLIIGHAILDLMDDPVGVWVSCLDWKWFESYFASLTTRTDSAIDQLPLLITADGQIVGKTPGASLGEQALGQIAKTALEAQEEVRTAATDEGKFLVSAKKVKAEGFSNDPKWLMVVAERESAALADVVKFRYFVLLGCLIVSLLGAAVIRHFAEKAISEVTTPLYQLGDGIKALRDGDLTTHVKPSDDPAMAQLAESFNETCAVLTKALNEVDATTHAVRNSTDLVADAVGNFGKGEAELVGTLKSVNAASREMASMSVTLTEKCKELETRAEEARTAAGRGASQVNATRHAMEQTVDSVGQITTAMDEFRHRLDRITKISQAIDKIAGETKLLALNATIEASHAGDAGKGFAVVASEMKNLATQSGEMSGEIRSVIDEIREGSGEVDKKVIASQKLSTEGLGTVASTEEALTMIRQAADNTTSGIEEISMILGIQSQAAEQIPQALDTIGNVSAKTRTDLDRIRETAENLLVTSRNMEEILRRFRR